MKEAMGKIVDLQEYKEKKKNSKVDRKELLELIKQVVTTK